MHYNCNFIITICSHTAAIDKEEESGSSPKYEARQWRATADLLHKVNDLFFILAAALFYSVFE